MVRTSTSTLRIDPEYFQKQHLADAASVVAKAEAFSSLTEIGIRVDASAFYPSIEEYYGEGELPFYRVGDVDGLIDVDAALRIPSELCYQFPTLKRVSSGDILFTKGGAIDRVGYVVTPGAVSRDLIFLDSSGLEADDRYFLFSYFSTDFFRRMLLRSSSQTTQPHLTVTLVRALPVFQGTADLRKAVKKTVVRSYQHTDEARKARRTADEILLSALGLHGWAPPQPLTYTARASEVMHAGRIDAQYFRPLFEEVEARLAGTGSASELGGILEVNARGRQPQYAEEGLPVINSKHVRTNRVILKNNRFAIEEGSPVTIERGDVLVNGTGVGTIGRAAPYIHNQRALPDNHVTVLRSQQVDPIYLAAFLNSPLGQWQIERHIRGSSGQIELYPADIARVVFWDAPKDIQNGVREAVLTAFTEERRAQSLLGKAKRAVEIAIEGNEAAALRLLAEREG